MRANLLLSLLHFVNASGSVENAELGHMDAILLHDQLMVHLKSRERFDNNLSEELIQLLRKPLEKSGKLAFQDLKEISDICRQIFENRNLGLSAYLTAVSRSLCFEFYGSINDIIGMKLEELETSNYEIERLKEFVRYSRLLPYREAALFQEPSAIQHVEILFDRLEAADDVDNRKSIQTKLEILISALRSGELQSAYKFRLDECEPLLRSIQCAILSQNINFEEVSQQIDKLLSKALDIFYYAMIIKTVGKLYSPDENVPIGDANFYSYYSKFDPDGLLLQKFEKVETRFKIKIQIIGVKRKHISDTILDFVSQLHDTGIKINIFLPQLFHEFMIRAQKETGLKLGFSIDAEKAIQLLKDNAAGIASISPGEEELAFLKRFPKNITSDEVKVLSLEEKNKMYGYSQLCVRMDASILLQSEPEDLKSIPSACLAAMKHFCGENSIDLSSIVPYLSNDAFTVAYHRLHQNTFLAMHPEQLLNYGFKEKLGPLQEIVPIELIHDEAFLKNIRSDVIAYTMENNAAIFQGEKLALLYRLLNERSQSHIEDSLKICPLIDVLIFFENLTTGVDNENSKRKYVENIPVNCWRSMRGVFGRNGASAVDIANILPYMDRNLFSTVQGNIHNNTFKNLTLELAENFGIVSFSYFLRGVDFDIIANDEALNSIPNKYLLASLREYYRCINRLTKDKILQLVKEESNICAFFSVEAFINGSAKIEIFSLLPYSCVKVIQGFWENICEIGRTLSPEFFQQIDIPPKKEYIFDDSAASNWALNNPQVCVLIEDDFPLNYVSRLPTSCQAHYYANPFNRKKINLDCIKEELFEEIVKVGGYKDRIWDDILQIPIHLRKYLTPDVIGTLNFLEYSFSGEFNLEGFPEDIFTLIKSPLPNAILEKLESKFLNYRLCLFHFADELPEETKKIEMCSARLNFIRRTFKDKVFFKDEFFRDLRLLFYPIWTFSYSDLDQLKDFDSKLTELLDECKNDSEFYEYLHEVIGTFDPIGDDIQMSKIRQLRSIDFKVIYNLLIKSPAHVIPSMQKYSFRYDGYGEREKLDFSAHGFGDGTIYPNYLYKLITGNAINLASDHSEVLFIGNGIDANGLSRAFVEQCVDFIYNGPDREKYGMEMVMKGIEVPIFSNPLLQNLGGKSDFFFPYRAHRDIGKFVAYTIVKALQSEALSGIELDGKFYRMLAIAKPEQTENGIEGLTEEEKVALNAYHESVFGMHSVENNLLALQYMYSEDEWFPRRTHFSTPFGPPVATNVQAEVEHDEFVYEQVKDEALFDEYLEQYRESTFAEFRALMWNFKQVLMSALEVSRLTRLWNLDFWTGLLGKRDLAYTADQVFEAINQEKNKDRKIDSLVCKKDSNGIYKIDFNDAVKMFLDHLNTEQLGAAIAMFTGTPRFTLIPQHFSFHFMDIPAKTTVAGSGAFQVNVLTREDLDEIIGKIYQAQIEKLGLDPAECQMAKSEFFPPLSPHTCFFDVDISLDINNYQLLFAFTQQINASPNAMEK